MYCDKFVVCVKVNGKILREATDIVYLPFGTEYSILLKNLNTKRAKANVYIDGADVLSGSALILDANSECELEGFVNTYGSVTHRFKFIEKTEQISNYRGDKPEDGLIRVVYSFENCKTFFDPKIYINPQDFRYDNQVYCKDTSGDYQHKVNFTISGNVDSRSCDNNVLYSSNCACNNDGITVKGSCSNQSFGYAFFSSSGEEKVIILKLCGTSKRMKVKKAITTKMKIQCEICGKKNLSRNKFCSNCGTALF